MLSKAWFSRHGGKVLGAVALAAVVALVLLLGARRGFRAEQYAQLFLDGIRGGSIYALIALGFVVIHSVTGIINFAQGEFVMLGAMLAVTLYNAGLPLPPGARLFIACLGAVVATAVAGLLVERGAIYPARRAPATTLVIITIGVTIAIRGLALLAWGTRPYFLPAFNTLALEDTTWRLGGVIVKAQSLWIWGMSAAVFLALAYFFERTILGKALRACAVNRWAAELVGIAPSRMSLLAFGLAAALGALGGIVLAPATRPTYDMGLMLGLKGFVAAIMGGMASYPGAVIGGLILGVAENIGAGVAVSGYKDIIAFVVLILVLLYRARGTRGVSTEG